MCDNIPRALSLNNKNARSLFERSFAVLGGCRVRCVNAGRADAPRCVVERTRQIHRQLIGTARNTTRRSVAQGAATTARITGTPAIEDAQHACVH